MGFCLYLSPNTSTLIIIQVKSELPSTFKAFRFQQHRWSSVPVNLFRKMLWEIIRSKVNFIFYASIAILKKIETEKLKGLDNKSCCQLCVSLYRLKIMGVNRSPLQCIKLKTFISSSTQEQQLIWDTIPDQNQPSQPHIIFRRPHHVDHGWRSCRPSCGREYKGEKHLLRAGGVREREYLLRAKVEQQFYTAERNERSFSKTSTTKMRMARGIF